MKLDKDYLKNLTIIKNTILRDQKNEWVTRFETSLKKKFFFQMSILFRVFIDAWARSNSTVKRAMRCWNKQTIWVFNDADQWR